MKDPARNGNEKSQGKQIADPLQDNRHDIMREYKAADYLADKGDH